jgi:hypothetical protein
MDTQLDIEYYLHKANEKIVRQMRDEIFHSIKRRVIRKLQKYHSAVLPGDILKNTWDEICVIIQEGDDVFYFECIDTLDGEIVLMLDDMKMTAWQLCAMWIYTPEGSEWVLDESDKIPDEIILTHNISDITKYIRDEYLLDAAMNWSNSRIERFQQNSYEMDDEY